MVYPRGMKTIYTRRPNDGERQALLAGLKSDRGTTVRRSQIILKSADQQLKAGQIGKQLGLSDQLVRNVLHAFNEHSTASLEPGSRARHDDQRAVLLFKLPDVEYERNNLRLFCGSRHTDVLAARRPPQRRFMARKHLLEKRLVHRQLQHLREYFGGLVCRLHLV